MGEFSDFQSLETHIIPNSEPSLTNQELQYSTYIFNGPLLKIVNRPQDHSTVTAHRIQQTTYRTQLRSSRLCLAPYAMESSIIIDPIPVGRSGPWNYSTCGIYSTLCSTESGRREFITILARHSHWPVRSTNGDDPQGQVRI